MRYIGDQPVSQTSGLAQRSNNLISSIEFSEQMMMHRIWFVVFVTFATSAMTGCSQTRLAELKAELAMVNAKLAATESELTATKSELAKIQAELSHVKANFAAATQEREIDIQLPETSAAQPLSLAAPLIIDILQDGKYSVEGKELNEEQLQTLLEQANLATPGQDVIIRGGGKLEVRYVAQAISLCDRAGIQNYSLSVVNNE